MRIKWTPAVEKYLKRHNKANDPLEVLLKKQEVRARKRVEDIAHIVDRWEPRTMFEIGPGLGVTALLLAQRYELDHLHLLDGDGTQPIQHDYQEDMIPWNDVHVAAELIRMNVPWEVEVFDHVVGTLSAEPPMRMPFHVDFVCSFKSWGVHYPVETYLREAHQCLNYEGLLIIDIREERGEGDKNAQVEAGGFKLIKQLDARVRAFERIG